MFVALPSEYAEGSVIVNGASRLQGDGYTSPVADSFCRVNLCDKGRGQGGQGCCGLIGPSLVLGHRVNVMRQEGEALGTDHVPVDYELLYLKAVQGEIPATLSSRHLLSPQLAA